MTVETDIANMALGHLQIGQMIESLDEASTAARQCKRWFDQCRDEVLRDFPHGFANKSEALALVDDQTYPGWLYVYQHPLRCAAIRAVADENGIRYARSALSGVDCGTVSLIARFPYQLALKNDGASAVILSDVPNAWVFFTAIVTNMSVWPVDARAVLALKLASVVGRPLQVAANIVGNISNEYEGMRLRAAANSRNESRDDVEADASSIRARL